MTACPDGGTACGGECVDTDTDALHCGGCDEACPVNPGGSAACEAGECTFVCGPGYADCNGDPEDGCESATDSDALNCGGCGNACELDHAQAACMAGECEVGSCDLDFDDCNGDPADGCEVDLSSDPSHCSGCGNACTASEVCSASDCVSSCTTGVLDGTETDVDCGGGACPLCTIGQSCLQGGDCASGKCANNHCAPLTLAFAAPATYPAGTWATSVALGDYDHDGDLDVASTDYVGGLFVRSNLGSGTLGTQSTYPLPWGSFDVVSAELNGDTHLDLAVTTLDANLLTIFLGTGNGAFTTSSPVSMPVGPAGVDAGDVDNDGDVDLAVAIYSSGSFRILHNNGAGLFQPSEYWLGSGPRGIALADFNGDARLDVVVADYTAGMVMVALQNTSGAFVTASQTSVGAPPNGVAVGDLNADGDPDVVVSAESQQFALVGNGLGGLTMMHQAPASTTWSAALGDFDIDGVLDAAMTQLNAPEFVVWRGTGTGTFLGPNAFAAASNQLGGAVGDMNGDGKLDVVMAGNSLLSVVLNAGQ
jgi:hypothetical protein